MESNESLVEIFLLMPDGREKANEHGIEKKFDKEIQKLRNKLPHVSFKERTILGFDGLAKQKPVTLEEMRAQCMWLKYGKKGETKEMYLEKYRNGEFDFFYKPQKE